MSETKEIELSESSKGFFQSLFEKLHLTNEAPVKNEMTPEAEVQAVEENGDIEALKARVAELEKALEERDALLAEKDKQIAEMQNACAQQKKDEEWNEMKNTVPAGWLENEAECRAEFESNPTKFALKLVNHKQQFANMAPAEGVVSTTPAPAVDQAAEYIKSVEEKLGIKFN